MLFGGNMCAGLGGILRPDWPRLGSPFDPALAYAKAGSHSLDPVCGAVVCGPTASAGEYIYLYISATGVVAIIAPRQLYAGMYVWRLNNPRGG